VSLQVTDGPLIEVRGLYVGYGDIAAVRDVNLTVCAGEVVALLGPNGAGKTTTLLTMCGALRPLSGQVLWCGRECVTSMHERVRDGIGIVAEERLLTRKLTVEQNLAIGRGNTSDAFKIFPQLEPLRKRQVGLLSGGEQQMLCLARCIAARPRLLLVDELSLGLAPIVVERLLVTVREQATVAGTGVLLVEQQLDRAIAVSDRWYMMRNGSVVGSGRSDDGSRKMLMSTFI
jgi:branched-chain amino acid transport system ATP-binding protein